MKKVAFILLVFISVCVSAQERSYVLTDIVGYDSTYFWKPFRTSGPVYGCFDFTGFSTDSVVVNPFYVFVNNAGEVKPTPIEWTIDANFPLALDKRLYQTITNGDTTNMKCFKIEEFFGDQFGFTVEPHNAISTDVLKLYIRK